MGSSTEKFNTKQNKEEKCRVARHEKVFAEHGKEWNKEKWISWNVWGKSTGGYIYKKKRKKERKTVIACWNIQGLKNKIQTPDFGEALKGVDIFGAVEMWTPEIRRMEGDRKSP
jgi:hypothetical protein